jgi:hypothetical protein
MHFGVHGHPIADNAVIQLPSDLVRLGAARGIIYGRPREGRWRASMRGAFRALAACIAAIERLSALTLPPYSNSPTSASFLRAWRECPRSEMMRVRRKEGRVRAKAYQATRCQGGWMVRASSRLSLQTGGRYHERERGDVSEGRNA